MAVRRPTLRAVALGAGATLGALLVAPRFWDAPDGGRIAPVRRPAPPAPAAGVASDAAPGTPGSAHVPPPTDLAARLPSRRWERHARAAVDRWIASTPHVDDVTAAERDALVTALGELRRAGLASRRRGGDATWQARQSARIAAADRVFRDTLGSGLSEFLAVVSVPEHVVDLGTTPP